MHTGNSVTKIKKINNKNLHLYQILNVSRSP